MDKAVQVSMSVNSEAVTRTVEPRQSLADFIRNELELTGTHVGCEHGVCGACTVRLDGQIVRGCLTLAVQADGCTVETIEGLTESGEIADLQNAFVTRNAAQCGFCTPGMLLTAAELLAADPGASREEIRKHISGNYCRCTGYQAVVDAIESTAQSHREGWFPPALEREGAGGGIQGSRALENNVLVDLPLDGHLHGLVQR